MNNIAFIVDGDKNTDYIDTLLVALFFKQYTFDIYLHSEPKNINAVYLQDIIRTKFVNSIRSGKGILHNTISEILIYSHECGWISETKNILSQQSILDYYLFLADLFCIESIETIDCAKNTSVKITKHSHITLCVSSGNSSDIKKLLEKKNISIKNKPNHIILHISGFCSDIKKCIRLNTVYGENDYMYWSISAIICLKKNHHYCFIYSSGIWYIYDHNNVPCIRQSDIYSTDIMTKIKNECIMLIYCQS